MRSVRALLCATVALTAACTARPVATAPGPTGTAATSSLSTGSSRAATDSSPAEFASDQPSTDEFASDVPPTSTSASSVPTGSVSPSSIVPADRSVAVYGDCRTPAVEPLEIVLTCADFGVSFQQLRWTQWSASRAVATGTLRYNDCKPNCASGTVHSVAATTITLTKPVTGPGGRHVWSVLQASHVPPGSPAVRGLPTRPE